MDASVDDTGIGKQTNEGVALRSEPLLATSPHSSHPPDEESRVPSDVSTPFSSGKTSEKAVEPLKSSSALLDYPPMQSLFFTTYSHGINSSTSEQLKLLKEGQSLYKHHHGALPSYVKVMPSLMDDEKVHVFYLPMPFDNPLIFSHSKILSGRVGEGYFVRPVVLLPSLMKPPRWLLSAYVNLSQGRCFDPVQVNWGRLSSLRGLVMASRSMHVTPPHKTLMTKLNPQNLTNGNEEIKDQTLHLWIARKSFGSKGEECFEMNGLDSIGELLDRPFVPSFIISTDKAELDSMCDAWIYSDETCDQDHDVSIDVGEGADDRKLKMISSKLKKGKKYNFVTQGSPEQVVREVIGRKSPMEVRALINDARFSCYLKEPKVFFPLMQFLMQFNLPELVILIIQKSGREMTFKALNYLVNAWTMDILLSADRGFVQTSATSADHQLAGKIERFLLSYIVEQRNPMSSTASVIYALFEEIKEYDDAKRFLSPILSRFRSLWMKLLDQLDEHPPGALTQSSLHQVFYPSTDPSTVNDASPMATAFLINDLEFVSHHLVTGYVKNQWKGRRFLILTRAKDELSLSLSNSKYIYRVMALMGFGGGVGSILLEPALQLWHLLAYCSYAFFNSPRGRWVINAVFELCFLTLFQLVTGYPGAFAIRLDIIIAFFVFTVGNLLDIWRHLYLKYGGIDRIFRYMADPWNAINLLTNLTLLILSITKLADFQQNNPEQLAARRSVIQIAFCSVAVFMWIRTLSIVIPVYPKLGPLLGTIYRMIGAIVTFMFPYVVILGGFASMLTGVYSDFIIDYSSWTTSMLTLFKSMLGGYSFSDFDADKYGNTFDPFYHLYGTIILVTYLLLVAILLMNLLIAIIVERYQPDSAASEAMFKLAQIVDMYSLQVQENYLPSPLNLAHAVGSFLPELSRAPMSDGWNLRVGLVNPDGPPIPDLHVMHPTGRGELPYLLYLLTIHPCLLSFSFVLYLLAAPLAVWQYTRFRCKRQAAHLQSNKVGVESEEKAEMNHVARNFFTRGAREGEEVSMSGLANRSKMSSWHQLLFRVPYMFCLHLFHFMVGSFLFLSAGLILYAWCGVVWWLWKVLFSCFNVLLRPILQMMSEARLNAKPRRTHDDVKDSENTQVSRDLPLNTTGDGSRPSGSGRPSPALQAKARWDRAVELVTSTPYHELLFSPSRVIAALSASEYRPLLDEAFLQSSDSTVTSPGALQLPLSGPSRLAPVGTARGDDEFAKLRADVAAQSQALAAFREHLRGKEGKGDEGGQMDKEFKEG